LLAFVCGASMVLAFAPFGVYPIAVLALALFYQLVQGCQGRGAFGLGWVFGLGLFGFGIFWIRISLNEFGNMAPAIANTLMLLFVAGMALYYGLAAWSIRRLEALLRRRRWVGPLLVLPAVWVLLEWVRGWLFTGFPWLLAGTGQIDGPLAGLAPVVGVHGVSLAVALSAGLLWGSVRWSLQAREADADAGLGLRRAARAAAVSLALLWGGAFGLGQIEWTRVEGAPFQAAIVQGNVEQSLKWHPDGLVPTLEIYLRLTRAVLDSALVVWPETAVPDFLHEVQQVLIEPLAQTARDTDTEIVIGVPIMETRERYYNGLISLGSTSDRYYKRHLVPFGEFLPFKAQLRPLIDWFEVPMSDFSRGSAPAPLLQVGTDEVGVSICYEDVFPDQVRQALPDADYLINVSNDAWFGDSLAPHQHLEQARMRALENGRWLVRATNSGISAFIDHRGRVQGSIPLFERASLTAEIERRAGATPFSRWGSVPTLALAALMLVAALLVGGGRRRGVH
jgi:apolipoprotein N-acyltransferase